MSTFLKPQLCIIQSYVMDTCTCWQLPMLVMVRGIFTGKHLECSKGGAKSSNGYLKQGVWGLSPQKLQAAYHAYLAIQSPMNTIYSPLLSCTYFHIATYAVVNLQSVQLSWLIFLAQLVKCTQLLTTYPTIPIPSHSVICMLSLPYIVFFTSLYSSIHILTYLPSCLGMITIGISFLYCLQLALSTEPVMLTYSMYTYLLYVPIPLAVTKQPSKYPIAFYAHLASLSNIILILSNRTYYVNTL